MGIDKGFDIVPRLRNNPEDNTLWAQFLEDVLQEYRFDPRLHNDRSKPFIQFKIGEHPKLQRDAWRFRRFFASISLSVATTETVEQYLAGVTKIAEKHFGNRVYEWYEGSKWPYYQWPEVYAVARGESCTLPGYYEGLNGRLLLDTEGTFNKNWR